MKSIIIIDLSAIFWRMWHANEANEINEARRRTVNLIESLSQDHDYSAIAVDCPPYFRNKIFEEYKAGRTHSEQGKEELRNCIKNLKSIGLNTYYDIGFEADDIIATLSKQALEYDIEVYVSGSDKDLLQIPGIKVFDPFDRKEKTAIETFGCERCQVIDVLALSGDKADNIPGIAKGIGPKKALQILEVIGNVEGFLSLSPEEQKKLYSGMKPAMAEAVKNGVVPLSLSYDLVQLNYDANVSLKLERYSHDVKKDESHEIDIEYDQEPEIEEAVPVAPSPPETKRNTEVAVKADNRNASWSLSLEPNDLNRACTLSKYMYQSGMFGQFRNPEAILAIVMRGRELGIGATTALSSFHVIEGKPTMHASLKVGLVLNSGKCEYFDLLETSREKAVWVTKRVGSKHEIKHEYTIEDAEEAGLLKPSKSGKPTNWVTRKKLMLRWRCATELTNIAYPDITTGLYTPEEIEESSNYA